MEKLRRDVFERAGYRCEKRVLLDGKPYPKPFYSPRPTVAEAVMERRCNRPAPWDGSIWERGHLMHLQHGQGKRSDTMETTLCGCARCHLAEHGTRFSGRKERMSERKSKPMSQDFFELYYHKQGCLCRADKPENSAMCAECRLALAESNAGLLHEIENGSGDPLLASMGEFRDLVRRAQ